MENKALLNEVKIRTDLHPGDIGYIIYMHCLPYKQEHDYGIQFEIYVPKVSINFTGDMIRQQTAFGFANTRTKSSAFSP